MRIVLPGFLPTHLVKCGIALCDDWVTKILGTNEYFSILLEVSDVGEPDFSPVTLCAEGDGGDDDHQMHGLT